MAYCNRCGAGPGGQFQERGGEMLCMPCWRYYRDDYQAIDLDQGFISQAPLSPEEMREEKRRMLAKTVRPT